MTAEGELFVTETVRDMVVKRLGRPVEIDAGSVKPKSWLDCPAPRFFPDSGEAEIVDPETWKPIGKVKWTVKFWIEEDAFGGRYIEADVDNLKVRVDYSCREAKRHT